MKKILLISIFVSVFGCKKDSFNEPDPNFIKIFISNHDTAGSHWKFNVYYTTDSLTFDTSSTPVVVFSGIKKDTWSDTEGSDLVKLSMNKSYAFYVIGYRTKPSDTLRHRFWFIPSSINKLIEIPAAEY